MVHKMVVLWVAWGEDLGSIPGGSPHATLQTIPHSHPRLLPRQPPWLLLRQSSEISLWLAIPMLSLGLTPRLPPELPPMLPKGLPLGLPQGYLWATPLGSQGLPHQLPYGLFNGLSPLNYPHIAP